MKFCSDCGAYFDDSTDICSFCGEKLDPMGELPPKISIKRNEAVEDEMPVKNAEPLPDFIQQSGRTLIINGFIRDTNSQELLQSKLTKLIHAVFSGEPYQFSHTSVITTLRVEEYPENNGLVVRARDVMVYGSIKGQLISGDDVTISAVQKGKTLVAKRIFNHSVDSVIKTQPSVSAWLIRAFAIALILCVSLIVYGLVTADYDAIGKAITDTISSLLPALVLGGVAYYYIRKKLKR